MYPLSSEITEAYSILLKVKTIKIAIPSNLQYNVYHKFGISAALGMKQPTEMDKRTFNPGEKAIGCKVNLFL